MLARLMLVCGLAVILPAVGSADFITFTDRAAWQTVAGTPNATEDFQGFTQDRFIYPTPVQANGFSIVANGSLPAIFAGRVDVLPFTFAGSLVSPNGTNFFMGSLVNDADFGIERNVILTFNSPVTAFGADLRTRALNEFIDVYGAGNALLGTISPAPSTTQFYGFALTGGERAERLVFRTIPTAQDNVISVNVFGMDNVAMVVPAPPAVILVGVGVATVALARRRRRA